MCAYTKGNLEGKTTVGLANNGTKISEMTWGVGENKETRFQKKAWIGGISITFVVDKGTKDGDRTSNDLQGTKARKHSNAIV